MQGSSTNHARAIADAVVTVTWEPTTKSWSLRATRRGTRVVRTLNVDCRAEMDGEMLQRILGGIQDGMLALLLW